MPSRASYPLGAAAEAEVRLPRPPGVIRRAFASHPQVVDITIVVTYFVGCGLMLLIDMVAQVAPLGETPTESGWLPDYAVWPLVLLSLLRSLAVGAALLFRRRYPLLGLVVTVLSLFGSQGLQEVANSVALLFLLYAVPVYRSVAAGWVGYGIAVIGTGLSFLATAYVTWLTRAELGFSGSIGGIDFGNDRWGAQFIGLMIMTALWYLAVVMIAINLGNRRRYIQAVIDRARQLARERGQLAELAVAEERSRIAREMHDIVAHSVSVMIALSEGAASAATAAPEAAADAMRRSAETGRTALAEMRRLLGALNSPEQSAELVPQPGLADLDTLARSFREAGLQVGLAVSGDASGDRGQELAVYRVVQEGLTNVLRYAGSDARAEVVVRGDGSRTIVEVRDYGRASGAPLSVTGVGSGRGLAGLAERVRVFGGTIESGPVSAAEGQGWRIRAELPINAGARQ